MCSTVKVKTVALSGHELLEHPLLNKGTAFTQEERDMLGLNGMLPAQVETLDEQVERALQTLRAQPDALAGYVYLRSLMDINETLYYAVVERDLYGILPLIYTPTVGQGCQEFSHIFRRPRGLFLRMADQDRLDEIFASDRLDHVRCIVVTDGERILGLGDQGMGGMGIPIGKLAIYTACGGIDPATTLPIMLDTGTNNPERLNDPMYLGARHERARGEAYDNFIDAFVQAVKRRWPNVLLQWEDFHKNNATRLLEKYRDQLCTFNDDVQGTASIAAGTLLAAVQQTGVPLTEQRIVILGGGSAGIGIADLIMRTMVQEGLSEAEARRRFYVVGRRGLVTERTDNLEPFQQAWAQDSAQLAGWAVDQPGQAMLLDVVRNVHPTVLVGVSGQAGAFPEAVIREMASHCQRPVVFPLSNPTSCVEAQPADIVRWTDGRAIVGTGSPFEPFDHQGERHYFAQCNNSYIFPGVGLGVIACGARRISDEMFIAASRAVAELSPALSEKGGKLLPALTDMRKVSRHVALAVARQARAEGVMPQMTDRQISEAIDATMWRPAYQPYALS
ncbi:MAG: NAD-dependent malic enzyme [Paludibacterium sp.]|uniref:NAD-dependent malic enzyme n=1 Tax=Paludibacterium sp. TaxID=1917523 RepID=UPI0025E9037A|nr:NAD-dependent malic enzyme [Paludibacterium sp.]MBV8046859.1 NAD-dependent malic enzyme [Paludibacterium sp.]MBV8647163.1 NAD-dependent malic enzyme [Paludibacterium sp.]